MGTATMAEDGYEACGLCAVDTLAGASCWSGGRACGHASGAMIPAPGGSRSVSAAFSSPRPPEKCDSDDQDHRGGKQEVSPRLPLASRRLSKKMARMFSRHDRRLMADRPEPPHSLARFSRAAVPRERSDAKTVESLRSPEMHNYCLSADSRRTKDMPLHNPSTDYNVPAVVWLSHVLAPPHRWCVQACFQRRLSGSVPLPGFRFRRGA
jgi:hypothetical protein